MSQAAQTIHGTLHGNDAKFHGVSTDTRTIAAGELFVALQGPNFDGSAFVDTAAAAQAAGAVVSRALDSAIPTIEVEDTRIALGQLASIWRQSMPAKIIGITGSNGKTTLKEMLACCLSTTARTLSTEGNLNNEIGLPLMLLRLDAEHEYAVIEMGANNPGEIAYLANLAKSNVAVITNAGPAHLEGFGSLEGVAHAKGEILDTDSRPQIAVLNADDPYFSYWQSRVSDVCVVSFGLGEAAMVRAVDIQPDASSSKFELVTPAGQTSVLLPLPGSHNVVNACAAAAVAFSLDLPIEQIKRGLESVRPVSGRLRRFVRRDGVLVYDDSYNANPGSVAAAAKFLVEQQGRSILVLGDMAELGDQAAELHEKVGYAAREAGVDILLATGELCRLTVAAFGEGGQWYPSIDELVDELRGKINESSTVLVKGSRAMQMERVVHALEASEAQVS